MIFHVQHKAFIFSFASKEIFVLVRIIMPILNYLNIKLTFLIYIRRDLCTHWKNRVISNLLYSTLIPCRRCWRRIVWRKRRWSSVGRPSSMWSAWRPAMTRCLLTTLALGAREIRGSSSHMIYPDGQFPNCQSWSFLTELCQFLSNRVGLFCLVTIRPSKHKRKHTSCL